MAKEKIITGIDIGSTKISTIVASTNSEKISVIGVSGETLSKGINRGNVVDIDAAVEAISHSLERAERMAGVSVSSAIVTISGSHIESTNSHGVVAISPQGSEININDVTRVTEAAQAVSLPSNREMLHVIPRDFVIDAQEGIKDPIGMSGTRLEVETNIIHGSSTAIRNLTKCIDQVGVSVEDVVYSGLASAEAVLTDTEKELGILLVDIGGGTTSAIAFLEGSPVFSTVLPFGAKYVTNDLAIGLRARLEVAEKIKLKLSDEDRIHKFTEDRRKATESINVAEFGLDSDEISRKFLYDVIDARVEEIFRLLVLELEKAHLLKKLPAGVVLTGGGSLTAGIDRVAKNTLKMPVRHGIPKGVTGLIDEIEGPAFSASVGCLIYANNRIKSGSALSFDQKNGNMRLAFSKLFVKLKNFLP